MDVQTLIVAAQRLAGRVDVGFDDRSLNFLNEAIEAWAIALPWSTLRDTLTLTCDGTRSLVFPDHVRTVRWLADVSSRRPIDARDFWDREAPDQYLGDTTGPASWWREEGVAPVYLQPTEALPAQITFRTTVSDTFTCHLTGLSIDTTQSGTAGYRYFAEERINVAGSGPATSANFYVKVMSCGRSKRAAVDTLILNGATQIGRIQANRQRSAYRRIEFLTIPGAGTQIRAGVIMQPGDLTEIWMNPHPSINLEFLRWYAAGLIHKAQNQSDQGELCIQRANQILSQRAYQEKMAGDKDLGCIPDQQYWGTEDVGSWW